MHINYEAQDAFAKNIGRFVVRLMACEAAKLDEKCAEALAKQDKSLLAHLRPEPERHRYRDGQAHWLRLLEAAIDGNHDYEALAAPFYHVTSRGRPENGMNDNVKFQAAVYRINAAIQSAVRDLGAVEACMSARLAAMTRSM